MPGMPVPGKHRGGRMRHPASAFSLTELVVVVAIIAVLAALLLPGIALVRDVARATRCASNLRQLGLGMIGYTADWDGVHAPMKTRADWCGLVAADYPYGVHWHDLVAPYVELDGQRFGDNNFRGVLWGCPAWKGSGTGWGLGGVNGGFTGYGRAIRLRPRDPAAPSGWGWHCDAPEWLAWNMQRVSWNHVARITRQSSRALVAESSNYHSPDAPAVGAVAPENQQFHRHRGRMNVLFNDLHLARLDAAGVADALRQE